MRIFGSRKSEPPKRPSSILSEHGEGYCRKCAFVVGLDPDGLMEVHYRGAHGLSSEVCDGSARFPQKNTPKEAGRFAFKTKPPVIRCDTCGQDVKVGLGWDATQPRMAEHRVGLRICAGSFQIIKK